MPDRKFPPSVEIKRAIAAATKVGVQIDTIEIHQDKIIIHARDPKDKRTPAEAAYDRWKAQDTRQARQNVRKTDALPRKPRT